MSIFDQEKNLLPGVTTEVEIDFNEDYDTSLWGTTEPIVIIGTAFDGPVNRPVRLYSPEYAKFVFGEVYDRKNKKEATLVKEFLDAWDKGARTVWGVRVSGKPLHKDFQLASTDEYKLRVSSIFPSNSNKDCYFHYDDTYNNSVITFYKPLTRTTMSEKTRGVVDVTKPTVKFQMNFNLYDLKPDNLLTDLIERFNSMPRNNVLRLSIIDKEGNDVTARVDKVGDINISSMFPGIYFIGRDRNKGYASTDIEYKVDKVEDEFGRIRGVVYKELRLNSDVNKSLPIFARKVSDLNSSFIDVGVVTDAEYNFLNNPNTVEKVFGKDLNDYEEVDLTNFEMYERLGSGFAITAKAELRKPDDPSKKDIKVIETPVTDEGRIKPIKDGVLSTLENLDVDYRILASVYADDVIRDRMPRKKDFLISTPTSVVGFNEKVEISTKVEKDDKESPRRFKVVLDAFKPEDDITEEIFEPGALYGEKTIEHVAFSKIDTSKYEEDVDIRKALATEEGIVDLKDGEVFLNFDGSDDVATLFRKEEKEVVPLTRSEVSGKILLADGKVLIGKSVEEIEKEIEIEKEKEKEEEKKKEEERKKKEFDAPEGKTFGKELKILVKGIEKDGVQVPVTLEDAKKIAQEEMDINLKTENIKLEEDTVKITGQLLTKADWNKLKSAPGADKSIPYRITVLYHNEENPKDRAFKVAIGEDGFGIVERLEKETPIDNPKVDEDQFYNKEQRALIAEALESEGDLVIKFKAIDLDELDEDAKFYIVSSNNNINVYVREEDELVILGTIDDITSDDDDKTLVGVEDVATVGEEGFNTIRIHSSALDYTTLDDLVDYLNNHPRLSDKFKFTLTKQGVRIKDEYVIDEIDEEGNIESIIFGDIEAGESITEDLIDYKEIVYDTSMYIPFKTNDNFARLLAQHCVVTSLKTKDTHGIIGLRPLTNTDLESVSKRVTEALQMDFELFAKKDNGRIMLSATTNEPFNIGDKVSIVFGQYPTRTGEGYTTVSNGASGYAGMVSAIPMDRSSTNQPVAIEVLSYSLSNYQLSRLTSKGFVTFKDSYTRGIVITDGVTAAPAYSPLRRLSSVKILKAVKDIIRRQSEPFIGKKDNIFNRASLDTAIDSELSKIKGILIEDYDFTIDSSKSRSKLGIIDIFFSIIPYNEIRNINSKIRVVDEITARDQQ